MDTITQGLLGAVTAQLGFRTRLGRSATWVAAITAAVPDLDVLAAGLLKAAGVDVGPFDRQVYHRGITHSLLVMPVLAFMVAGIWWAFRRRQFGWLFLCCLVAALSHPLLDWCTTYGTQLLAPVSSRRFAIDAVPIVDLIYTPLLILTLLGSWTIRKLGRRRGRSGVAAAWVGFGLSVAYLAAGRVMHDTAVSRGLQAYRRARVTQPGNETGGVTTSAHPGLGSIFVWRVVVRSPDRWYVGRTHTLFDRPIRLRSRRHDDDRFVRAAREEEQVELFHWFADGSVRAESRKVDGRRIVDFHDMRYGAGADSLESLWLARVRFDNAGNVHSVRRVNNFRSRHGGRAFSQAARTAWRDLFRP